MEAVQTAITGMATSVQEAGLTTLGNVLPVLATLLAAMIVARLGYKLVTRFSGKG